MKIFKFIQVLCLVSGLNLLTACSNMPPSTPSGQSNWQTLDQILPNFRGADVQVMTNARHYQVGDPIRFQITSSKAGKLWIIEVNQQDRVSVIFPHQKQANNIILANTPMMIPDSSWGVNLQAAEPRGQSQVAFIVTPIDKTLEDVVQIDNGKLAAVAFPTNSDWGIQRVYLEIK